MLLDWRQERQQRRMRAMKGVGMRREETMIKTFVAIAAIANGVARTRKKRLGMGPLLEQDLKRLLVRQSFLSEMI